MGKDSTRTLHHLGIAAMVFGALTLFSGGRALWGPAAAQVAMGEVVSWVLWFNFCAGFVYVVTGWGLWRSRAWWALWCSVALAVLTAAFALALAWHIFGGGGYEIRTVSAMALRLAFWAWVATACLRARNLFGSKQWSPT